MTARLWPDVLADRSGLRRGPTYGQTALWFAGKAAGWRREGDDVVVSLRDALHLLEVPLQAQLYAGTGGVEGGADLANKPKPLAYGQVYNVPPVPLGTVDLGDGALATYQVHDGAVMGVDAVRVRGAALDAVTAAPLFGEYRVHAAQGLIQIGGGGADGAVTADVRGASAGGSPLDLGRIVRRLLVDRLGLTDGDLDLPAFSLLSWQQPGAAGFYQGPEPVLALDLIERLLAGIGGFLAPTRAGLVTVGRLDAPALPANLTLGPGMVMGVEDLALPNDLDPPAKRRRVGYRLNYAPSADLAGAVSDDERANLSQAWRIAAAFSSAVAAAHQLATDPPPVASPLYEEGDAATEAARLLALHAPGRRWLRVTTDRFIGQVQIGMVAALAAGAWPYRGLAAGWLGTVTGYREALPAGTLELDLYG